MLYLSIIVSVCLTTLVKISDDMAFCLFVLPLLLFVIMWILLLIRGSDDDNQFGKKIVLMKI